MDKKLSTKNNIQLILICLLCSLLIMVIVTGVTFAWYTRNVSDKLGVTLSHPVEIYISDYLGVPQGGQVELPTDEAIILPGTKINVNLGFIMGKEDKPSSPAFVRVKLEVTSDALTNLGGNIVSDGLIDFNTTPLSSDWVEVDFGENDGGKWWVFSENVDGNVRARIAYNQESHVFLNGQIKISTTLTNIFANKNIFINYKVSAIQSENVENPILNRSNPTWGKLVEESE